MTAIMRIAPSQRGHAKASMPHARRKALGEPRAARELAERAVGIAQETDVDPAEAAQARCLLARALVETGGDRQRARTLFDAGRTVLAKLAHEMGNQ